MKAKNNNLQHVKNLIFKLSDYKDTYSKTLKEVLINYINKPKGELSILIDKIPLSNGKNFYNLYDVNIKMLLSEIYYPN